MSTEQVLQLNNSTTFISDLLTPVRVVPVLIIRDIDKAINLAEAMVAGGLHVLEVTLRTKAALDAITEMGQVPGAVVGVGTLTGHTDVTRALYAGAQFGVSPGSSESVLDACEGEGLPLLPGVDNVTDAMWNYDRGYAIQKFFPAEQSGGIAKLQALSSPLPKIRFCPTGGVNLENAQRYLSLPNVVCVGGSWVAPSDIVDSENWTEISELARQANGL